MNRSAMGRQNRRKGREHEREIELTLINLGAETDKSREAFRPKPWDVRAVLGDVELRIQCKRRKKVAFLSEIHKSMTDGGTNVWAIRPDNIGNYAILKWDYFLELLSRHTP